MDKQDRKILEGGFEMKIKYSADADILMLILRDDPPVDSVEEPEGIIVSYGEDGSPVSIELLNASIRHLVQPGEVNITVQTETVIA